MRPTSRHRRTLPQRRTPLRRERGVTLIELVIAITIVGIAATAVLGAIGAITTRGAVAMARQQAVAIAEAYLEEILLQPVAFPGGTVPATRASFNDVDQYNGLLDVGARDQYGNAIANLSGYTVSVAVVQTATLTGIASNAARRIDVTVTDPTGGTVSLSGYRTNY